MPLKQGNVWKLHNDSGGEEVYTFVAMGKKRGMGSEHLLRRQTKNN